MAFASLFTLIDDITTVLDDVALMTKVAAKKTVGVVGDDLALNANQVSGVHADRELPIVWAVAKGSLMNKVILIPIALILAVFAPMLIVPLLMLGGAFLCFEGVEKLLHRFLHSSEHAKESDAPNGDNEAAKIKGAIRTDFILSAEIIIIALGAVKDADLLTQIIALSLVGVGITLAVYGVVAIIVKLDDFGLWLIHTGKAFLATVGRGILRLMPWFMRGLSVVGTLAMFSVGGSIFTHNTPMIHDFIHQQHWDTGIWELLVNLVVGLLVGAVACALVLPMMNWWAKRKAAA